MSGDAESGSGLGRVAGLIGLGVLGLFGTLAKHSDTLVKTVTRHGDDVGRAAVHHADELTPALRNTDDATRHLGGLPYHQAAEAEGRAVGGAADHAAAGVVETEGDTLLDKVTEEVTTRAAEEAINQAVGEDE